MVTARGVLLRAAAAAVAASGVLHPPRCFTLALLPFQQAAGERSKVRRHRRLSAGRVSDHRSETESGVPGFALSPSSTKRGGSWLGALSPDRADFGGGGSGKFCPVCPLGLETAQTSFTGAAGAPLNRRATPAGNDFELRTQRQSPPAARARNPHCCLLLPPMASHRVSDFLCDRHPYNETPFQTRIENESSVVFLAQGPRGIERLVGLLRGPDICLKDAASCLRILKNLLFSQERKIEAMSMGVVPAINALLRRPDVDHQWIVPACDVLEALARVPQGCDAIGKCRLLETFLTLLYRIEDPSVANVQLETDAVCRVLETMSRSRHGSDVLCAFTSTDGTGGEYCITYRLCYFLPNPDISLRSAAAVLNVLVDIWNNDASMLAYCISPCGLEDALIQRAQMTLARAHQASTDVGKALLESLLSAFIAVAVPDHGKAVFGKHTFLLGRLLAACCHLKDAFLMRLCSEALSLLSIQESCKRLSIEVPSEEKGSVAGALAATEAERTCCADVALHALANLDNWAAAQADQNPETWADCRQNLVRFLRHICEFPETRLHVCNALQRQGQGQDGIWKQVFEETTLFQPFGSSTMDLAPDAHDDARK